MCCNQPNAKNPPAACEAGQHQWPNGYYRRAAAKQLTVSLAAAPSYGHYVPHHRSIARATLPLGSAGGFRAGCITLSLLLAFQTGVIQPTVLYGCQQDETQQKERAEMYEYKVIEIREKMVGGKMSGSKLEQILNENATQGWQLKAITSADVKGRMGPGGVEGLLVTFERTRQ